MNANPRLLEKVARATVGVHSQVPESHVSAAIGLGTDRRGTGTLVSSDGLILTVHYMLLGANSVIVTLVNGDQLPAKIIAKDYHTGLGLLKIEGSNYPRLEVVSAENCMPGQEVFSVASLGGEKRCADTGMITYTGPFDAVWEFVLDRCLCVTASSLNIGLSGGPVCNSRGEVIGVSYLNFADMGRVILAIPGECVLQTRDELIKFGKRVTAPSKAWIGVISYTVREHVVIAGVMPGSPGD
ncbi:MAG TPA: S1C family serine protease, partial [Candidatus Binataceae bacterium]|nr:S1C family serine protease [Candidatus Binataceae bacterium]